MPERPEVTLRPLRAEEFDDWRREQLAGYAQELVSRFSFTEADARARAEREFGGLLPDGLATTGARIAVVEDVTGRAVGRLWWGDHPRVPDAAFVYDIAIADQFQGRGFGRAAMLAAEAAASAAGKTAIGLSVTASNRGAHGLYESLGYENRSINMHKSLDRAAAVESGAV